MPTEAVLLYADRHPVMLGLMLACTGVTQLISPVVGYISDRNTSRWGRRRGLMVGGTLMACVGCLCMWYSRERGRGGPYILALTLCVFGVNVVYSCYTALLPDFVATAHMGRASGVMAAMSMLGSFCGFGLFGFWLQVAHAYPLYVAVLSITVGITCTVCSEVPQAEAAPLRCGEMLAAYTIDATGSPDFFWVFVTRTFYYMGISLQAFSLFMLRDVQQVSDPKYYTSVIAMVGQLAAAAVAVPAGRMSDELGRKPLVYASCAIMAMVSEAKARGASGRRAGGRESWLGEGGGRRGRGEGGRGGQWGARGAGVGFGVRCGDRWCRVQRMRAARSHTRACGARDAAILHATHVARPARIQVYLGFAFEPSVPGLLALGVAYGVGNGMFLSVDYALACDVLPSFDNAAQSLGVWGVSAFLGSTLGPLAAGPTLSYFGRTESPDRFSTFGYILVMAMGAIYVSLAALLLRNVNEGTGEKGREARAGRGLLVQR